MYNVDILDNYFNNCYMNAIMIYGNSKINIKNNNIINNRIESIYLNQCNYANIIANSIKDDNGFSAIKIYGSAKCNIINNVINGIHRYGIEFVDSAYANYEINFCNGAENLTNIK